MQVARYREADDDISLTANLGGKTALLPSALKDDPNLQSLAKEVRDAGIARLQAEYSARRKNTNEIIKRRDMIDIEIVAARRELGIETDKEKVQKTERRILSLEREFSNTQQKIEQAIIYENNSAAKFENAQSKLVELQNYFIGKSVSVVDGTIQVAISNPDGSDFIDKNGSKVYRSAPNIKEYEIRGPNPKGGYASKSDAATDAIALSWAVVRATGLNIEYGGYIYEDFPGNFTYNKTMEVGRGAQLRTLNIALSTGGTSSTVIQPPNPSRNEVGMFHIHPINSVNDTEMNKFFGPGDLFASQQMSRAEGVNLSHYLGGSDGGIRMLPNPRDPSLPIAPPYRENDKSTYTYPPQNAYQQIKPPGYFAIK